MAVVEPQPQTEQLTYDNAGWQELASEVYRYAGDRYPAHLKRFGEHVYRKAGQAQAAGKDWFSETLTRDDAHHVRNAASRCGVKPVSGRGG